MCVLSLDIERKSTLKPSWDGRLSRLSLRQLRVVRLATSDRNRPADYEEREQHGRDIHADLGLARRPLIPD
jgi:hypothetical protein